MNNFLILGLPRSRTAWLANFLTHDGLFCYHEGSNGCRSLDEYKLKLAFDNTGDANTGLVMFDIKKLFPDFKIVVIDSEPERSIEFSKDVLNLYIEHEILLMKQRLDDTEGLHVSLEELNMHLRGIWDYVSDCKPFDGRRADMLINLDVQIRDPRSMDLDAAQDFINDCYS
jgi:hypothetical protein